MVNWIGLYTFIRRETERTTRVLVQTIISPIISATLYIFIFGFVVGSKIDLIVGVKYITFVFPGILMLNIIASSFAHSSTSVYFGRFIKSIEEVLIAPFSYIEIVVGYSFSAVIRALIVACGILLVGLFFGAVTVHSFSLFLFYVVSVSIIFSLLGILVGLWAKNFEQLSVLNTFIITPFTYLGGIFYSITMLPEFASQITRANPFFYFVDGIRYSMIGVQEGNTGVGLFVIFGLITVLGWLTIYLFKIGWRIRA